MKKICAIAAPAILLSSLLAGACAYASDNQSSVSVSKSDFNNLVSQGVPADALRMALNAQHWAIQQGKVKNSRYLTVVEFNVPSTQNRMQVIDLQQDKVLFNELVSQGQGSGPGNIPTTFSDKTGSHSSVHGALVTGNTYGGKHGNSLRLIGIESFNKNALSRDIVVHQAPYATASFAKSKGHLGRSWGCFALSPAVAQKVIPIIQGGTVLFAYAPQAASSPNYA